MPVDGIAAEPNRAGKRRIVLHVAHELPLVSALGALVPMNQDVGVTAVQASCRVSHRSIPPIAIGIGPTRLAVRRPADEHTGISCDEIRETRKLVAAAGRSQWSRRARGSIWGGRA